MQAVCGSHKGLVRNINQDWVEVRNFSGSSCLVVVCDGIGGSAGGEIASREASEAVVEYFENNKENNDVENLILESLKYANNRISEMCKSNKSIASMGTTSVIAFVDGYNLHVANVGDSRAYVISKDEIIQITDDHSVVNELVSQGKLTADQAKIAPNKNIITRALGHINSTPDYYNRVIRDGEKILVCTDGLTNCLSDEKIHQIVLGNEPKDAVDVLIAESNSIGGPDNITVSIIF